jgi:hypothetical protein
VFISTPKACTHSIYKILDEHYSDGLLEAGFHNNQIPPAYKDYYKWTVVRNPFTRAVSIWWSACRLAHLDQYKFRELSGGQYDFTKFITWLAGQPLEFRQKDPLMLNQCEWLKSIPLPMHFLYLENLASDLKRLPFWKEGIEIEQLNTTDEKIDAQSMSENRQIEKPSIQELYKDQAAIDAVLKWAEPDFEWLDYDTTI